MKYLIREILSAPFVITGWVSFRLAEVIKGQMLTYRKDEVVEETVRKISAPANRR